MSRASVSLSKSILPPWMSRLASSRHNFEEAAVSAPRTISGQRSGFDALNDSSAR